jgi:hypothetical protein
MSKNLREQNKVYTSGRWGEDEGSVIFLASRLRPRAPHPLRIPYFSLKSQEEEGKKVK